MREGGRNAYVMWGSEGIVNAGCCGGRTSHCGSKQGGASGYSAFVWCGCVVHAPITHRRELAAALFGALRGAAHDDARGDACEDPAEGADDAGDASGEANHREDGAVTHACETVQSCT